MTKFENFTRRIVKAKVVACCCREPIQLVQQGSGLENMKQLKCLITDRH